MAEDVIYEAGGAVVTATLVRIGGVSYPVNGIGSVRIAPSGAAKFFVLAAIAALVGAANPEIRAFAFFGAIVLVLVGFSAKAKLVIRTASGDQTALTARRKTALSPIMEAIERAVSIRG